MFLFLTNKIYEGRLRRDGEKNLPGSKVRFWSFFCFLQELSGFFFPLQAHLVQQVAKGEILHVNQQHFREGKKSQIFTMGNQGL